MTHQNFEKRGFYVKVSATTDSFYHCWAIVGPKAGPSKPILREFEERINDWDELISIIPWKKLRYAESR